MTRIFIILGGALCIGACVPAGAPPAFYQAHVQRSDLPGTLIEFEALDGAPAGARAFRVVYSSTDPQGRRIPVSGVIVVPSGYSKPVGRPVVAWAHPTTGVQPRCAPSLSPLKFLMMPGLSEMMEHGYVVTATDYPGLGSGAVHPFLDGESEGRAVLDSVRAAIALPGSLASREYALWGHSQGGQAALFAANISAKYAPDLQLKGVATAAPATDLATLLRDDIGTVDGDNLTALTLWSWARIYNAAYDHVVKPEAMPAISVVAHSCWDVLIDSNAEKAADKVLVSSFLSVPDITKVEPWRTLAQRNTPRPLPRHVPAFFAQGDADVIVRPSVTYRYVESMCRRGSRVTLKVLPKITHDWIAIESAATAVAWIADRFEGKAAPSTCRSG